MPFTANKGFSVPATGSLSGTWGSDGTTPTANVSSALNEGVISLLDEALGGVTTLTLGSSNISLSQAQTQNGMLRLTGTVSANIVISPAAGVLMTGFYMWESLFSGSFIVTIQNSAGSVQIPRGRRGMLWVDPANGPRILAQVGATDVDPLPLGSSILFFSDAVPAGWSQYSFDDYGLRLVSAHGGALGSGTAYSTVFSQTQTNAYALTVNDIPSHSHTIKYATLAVDGASSAVVNAIGSGSQLGASDVAGGGAAHVHGMDLRVRTATVIAGTRL